MDRDDELRVLALQFDGATDAEIAEVLGVEEAESTGLRASKICLGGIAPRADPDGEADDDGN